MYEANVYLYLFLHQCDHSIDEEESGCKFCRIPATV